MEYLLLGTRIDPELAHSLGLANRVVDDERAAARELAQTLAAGPPLALAAIKRAVRDSAEGGIDAALQRERVGQTTLLASRDFGEGVAAVPGAGLGFSFSVGRLFINYPVWLRAAEKSRSRVIIKGRL